VPAFESIRAKAATIGITIAATLFGKIAWQPPNWLTAACAAIRSRLSRAAEAIKTHPRETLGAVAAVVLLCAFGFFWWRWYERQPKPVEFEYSVSGPTITCYSCEPQGKPNPVTVSFSGSTAPLDRVGHAVDAQKSGISLSPRIEGLWLWDDDHTLRFQPAVDWPIDTSYKVKLSRNGFAAAHVHLREYEFEFKTAPFTARLANTEFYQDPIVARNKNVVATLTFSHPVDADSLEKRIKLKMFDRVNDRIEKELAVPSHTVVFDKLKLNAYIHSGELEIPPKSGRLEISVTPGTHASRGGNELVEAINTSVKVPGLNSLLVQTLALDIARDERNEPNQILLVSLSASVKEQELAGKLNAWLLPEKHPDPKVQANFERYNANKPFHWSPATVKPEVLSTAQRLDLKQIPGEREHYELHSFRYSADPGRQIFVSLPRGLQSFGGYLLGDNADRILQVPEFPRELSILHEGSLLAMSGDKTLTLLSRNVPTIRVEVGRLLPKQLQHLVTQTGGSFGQPQFHNWAFAAENITETFTKTIAIAPSAPGTAHYEALDLGQFLHKDAGDRRGIFLLRVQAWDPEHDRALSGYSSTQWRDGRTDRYNQGQLDDARLIVLTDLGLVVKRSLDGTQDVFVQSLHTGRPVQGATVSVIGLNGLPVLNEVSDTQGHVRFGDLKNYQREKKPALYLATLNGDSSFLPTDDRVRTLDLSRFDVGGIDNRVDRQSLSAYLFSDRGIYRPGEQIRLAAIIRSQDWRQRLSGVPLRLEVTDPRGTLLRRESIVSGAAGFNEIIHDTKESSPSGTYTFALSIVRNEHSGDLIGTTTVQVREFLPDRLRMQVKFSAESLDGWVSPADLQAETELKNLFGTAAEKRRVSAQLTLSPSFPSFRAYPDYRFFDPELARESFSERLSDAETDAQGKVSFQLNLKRFARATYRLHVMAEGFEADGGRGVSADATQLVSNLPHLVGYKPDGSLDYIARDSRHSVELIAIDPNAKRKQLEQLTLTRIEIKFVSVLLQQSNGTYKYESRRKETELSDAPFAISTSGTKLVLDTASPGSYAYAVRDSQGQQLTRIDYQVTGDANVTRKMDKNAELELKLAKHDFSPGEDIELSIRAPYAGAGLITIERDRVYEWRWFKASTTASVQHIRVPEALEGNAYVTVTFVRDPGSDEIFSSPLSYGVQPFSISLDSRRNVVSVEAPAKVKPGESVTLRYKTERPARILLFAVDEGILQVARYENPRPLEFFFQKRALSVSTAQILDLLLPEFRRLGLNAAPGGDGEALLSQHLNPFRRKGEKPMAYWSGILDADSSTREVSFTVPDYFNGSLRVLAVAAADERIGAYTGTVTVRGDFVLSPNAPTTVSPGDEFDVSVGVSNNVIASGAEAQVDVTIEPDSGLEIVGNARQQAKIGEGHEDSVRFRLRARDQLGAQAMKFTATTASGSGGSATRRIDLSLRPATPYMTQLTAGVIRDESRDVTLPRDLYPHYRKLEASISILPLGFANGFVSYLSNYPYACTEQIVSQALPALILGARPEFGHLRTQTGASLVGLLSELRSRQNDEGAYKLWPGSSLVVEFASLYAQHALIEAGDRGERIPGDIVLRGNTYLRKIAARDGNNLADERNSAFAIYLLTRQALNTAAELAALRKRLDDRYKKEWTQDLTAMWLAATYDLLKKDNEAARLLRGVRFTETTVASQARDIYFDPMTHDALLLWITAKHFPETLNNLSPDVLANMAKRISDGWYVSLSAGTTLLALDAYASAGASQMPKLSITELLRTNKGSKPLSLPEGLFPKTSFSEQAQALRVGNASELNAYYVIDQSGFDRKPPTTAIRQGMEILREYTDVDGKALANTKMGQEILVHLKFRGLGRHTSNIALVDLLPGGFELVVPPQSAIAPHLSATLLEDRNPADGERNVDSRSAYEYWACQICAGGDHGTLQYADLREDRVVFYADATPAVQEIIYRIKATNVGKFMTPPAYGEAMYDRSVVARSTVGTMEVVRP
jgi:uncharacterized protein YfaS (alpha-2-macroglobulin family)